MLVLSRKPQETIVLDCGNTNDGITIGGITITVVDVRGNQVRLGIEAPRSIAIQRGELRRDEALKLRHPVVGCRGSDS